MPCRENINEATRRRAVGENGSGIDMSWSLPDTSIPAGALCCPGLPCCPGFMKKLSPRHRFWLIHHAARSANAKRRSKEQAKFRRCSSTLRRAVIYNNGRRRKVWIAKIGRKLPGVLCFESNYEVTAGFFRDLSNRLCENAISERQKFKTMRNGPRSWSDFSTSRYISPAAGLVLAAEFDRSRKLAGVDRLFTINMDDWDPDVRATLVELGFLPLLGIDPPSDVSRPVGSTAPFVVPFRSEKLVDMAIASQVLRHLIQLAASAAHLQIEVDPLSSFRDFLTVIGEALTNTSDHAYPPTIHPELPTVGRWWISGSVDPAKRKLRFTVYDQGVTIPRALPLSRNYGAIQRFLRLIRIRHDPGDVQHDGSAIAAAVRTGASGTGLASRGHGLTLMRNLIMKNRVGTLRIISRNGEYVARTRKKDQIFTRSIPLRGTLVEWTVDL